MTIRQPLIICSAALLAASVAFGQTPGGDQPYKPGVTFQSANPNYPIRNPFYFEGRIDWNLLKIDQPKDAWEFAQRGIYKQDDLEDVPGAIEDYRKAISLNNLRNGTCQLILAFQNPAPARFGQTFNPPPCMFTARLRLGRLLMHDSPDDAIELFKDVVEDPDDATAPKRAIDPKRLGVHSLIAETYTFKAENALNESEKPGLYANAIAEYGAELKLSPITTLTKKLTGDEENNAHVHWALAEIYDKLGDAANEMKELDAYLKATKWHSDTYPWRIQLAQKKMEKAEQRLKNSANNEANIR